ncbi:MAG: hypothetical protein U9O55_01890 [Patescibacteria group bacterium]|nr:hypothetical protein [Patescibacteria group bacterium]
MFLRYKLDKNGKKIPDAKCPKCNSDAFKNPFFEFTEAYECGTCNWCWFPEDDTGFYSNEKDEKKCSKNCKIRSAVPLIKGNHKWEWMPFTKDEYKRMNDK